MRVHWVRHVPYEGLGNLEPWLVEQGHRLSESRPYDGGPFPDPAAFDALLVVGGPMGVCDIPQIGWLGQERDFIRRTVDAGRPVLGICLGGQLLASALGAEVRRHLHPEIGWHELQATDAGATSALRPFLRPGALVMQWHFDTFDLPAGAELLCGSVACANQAFRVGSKVMALQFHPEMTYEEVGEILRRDGSMPGGDHVQSAVEILQPARFDDLAAASEAFIDRLFQEWRS